MAGRYGKVMADHVEVEVDGEKIRVSSPNRVVFPDRGWTKLDVVEHFVTVLPGAFRAVRDRPTMLKRYLQGVGTDPIYQKRAKPGDRSEERRVGKEGRY